MSFDRKGKCPRCRKHFPDCPCSYAQVEQHLADKELTKKIEKIVDKRVKELLAKE